MSSIADLGPDNDPRHHRSDTDRNGDFDGAVPDPEVVAEAWDTWRAEVAFAERFVAEAPDLGVVGKEGTACARCGCT